MHPLFYFPFQVIVFKVWHKPKGVSLLPGNNSSVSGALFIYFIYLLLFARKDNETITCKQA